MLNGRGEAEEDVSEGLVVCVASVLYVVLIRGHSLNGWCVFGGLLAFYRLDR